jgi:hypothetical protein
MYGVVLIDIARARGGLEELVPMTAAMVEQFPLIPAWKCGLVYLESLVGAHDRTRALFEELATNDFEDIPTDANWLIGIAILVAAAAFLGDAARAARLYDLLLPYRDFSINAGMPALSIGSCEALLANAAATAGRWDAADEHFERGIAVNDERGNRAWKTHQQYDYAVLLARRSNPDDAPRLRELLCTILAEANAMGMTRVVAHTRSLAERSDISLG